MALKDLKIGLIVEALDRATAPLRKIAEGLGGVEERAHKLGAAFHKLGMAEMIGGAFFTGAVAAAGKGVYDLTDRVAELGEGYVVAAKKAGLFDRAGGVEALQKLQFATKQLGGDADALGMVFFRFQTHLANAFKAKPDKETVSALKLLGISIADAKRLSADPEEAFLRLADGFHNIKNATERAKLALDLFSRSGVQMLPVLMAGRGGLKPFMDQMDAAHDVMSKKDAEAAETFIQNKNRMGLALQGLQLQIGVRLMPVMTAAIDRITAWIEKMQPAVVDRFTRAIDSLVAKLPELLPRLERAGELGLKLADRLLKLTDNAGVVKGALIALAAVLALQVAVGFAQTLFAVGRGIVMFTELVGTITGLVELAAGVTTFADAMALLDIALDANPIGIIVLAIGALIAVIAGIGVGVYQIYKHWSGITSWFKGVWDSVAKVFSDAWTKLSNLTPDWLKTLLKIGAVGAAFTISPGAGMAAAAGALAPHAGPAPKAGAPAAQAPKGHLQISIDHDGKPTVKSMTMQGMDLSVVRGLFSA